MDDIVAIRNDAAIESITPQLERIVSLAANYTQSANFFNEVIRPKLDILGKDLPDQDARLVKVMKGNSELSILLTNLAMNFAIVSQKLAEAQRLIPLIPIDPEYFQTSERTT
jgi:hypothetical protein